MGAVFPSCTSRKTSSGGYFDAQLTDGRTLVLVFYIDQDAGERRFVYRVQATVASPTGQRVAAEYVTHQDVSISRERPEIHIGKSFLRGDLDTYRVVMDASDLGKLGLDVTIRRTFPPRVSPADRESIVQADKIFGWVCPVPRGELTGAVMVNGETATVKGVAYHDHNWGTAAMGSLLHHWIWGRAAIGPYTAVYASENRARRNVGEHLGSHNVAPWEEVRNRLNQKLKGWKAYFGLGSPSKAFEVLDEHVEERVRHFLRRRHKVQSQGTRQFSMKRIFGELGVFRLRGPLRGAAS